MHLEVWHTNRAYRTSMLPCRIVSHQSGRVPSSLLPSFGIERRTTYIDLQVHQKTALLLLSRKLLVRKL
jgi:hypothetical protein